MQLAHNQAQLLFKANKISAAARLFEEVLKQDPENMDAKLKLGVCRFRQKSFELAETIFRQLTATNHQNFNAWYYLGLCYERHGKPKDSITAYRIALAINPNFEAAKKKLKEQLQHPASETAVFKSEPSEGPGEILYKANHRRISSFTTHCILIGLLLGGGLLLYIVHNSPSALALLFLAIGVFILIDVVLRSRFTKYILYERRIDIKKGILFRDHSSVWLYEITGISFSRNPLNVVTGDSRITLDTGHAKYELTGMTAPKTSSGWSTLKFTQSLFDELRNTVRDERGNVKKIWI